MFRTATTPEPLDTTLSTPPVRTITPCPGAVVAIDPSKAHTTVRPSRTKTASSAAQLRVELTFSNWSSCSGEERRSMETLRKISVFTACLLSWLDLSPWHRKRHGKRHERPAVRPRRGCVGFHQRAGGLSQARQLDGRIEAGLHLDG